MKSGVWLTAALAASSVAAFAASDAGWARKVPQADRERRNPYAGQSVREQSDAVAAGGNLFEDNCAKCHGAHGQGKGGRPVLAASEHLRAATDGEIAWLIKNGQPFRGMPGWGSLPEQERWQIVAYLRSLNPQSGMEKDAAGKEVRP